MNIYWTDKKNDLEVSPGAGNRVRGSHESSVLPLFWSQDSFTEWYFGVCLITTFFEKLTCSICWPLFSKHFLCAQSQITSMMPPSAELERDAQELEPVPASPSTHSLHSFLLDVMLFYFIVFTFTHTCMHCLGHPPSPPPTSIRQNLFHPLVSNFVEEIT
jgi:hypothetical protein